MNKTFIIIPAYNEEKHIGKVIDKCKKICKNIIVVDDGSTDNTFSISKKKGVIVLNHIINLGKGAAMKTGCDYAVNKGAKKIIFFDADDQHDSSMIKIFDKALDKFDVAIGYRDLNSVPFYRRVSNYLGIFLVRLIFGIPIRDVSNGFRGFRADSYSKLKWDSTNYEVETEMVVNLAKSKLTFTQIKVKVDYHDNYKGIGFSDAVITALKLFWWRIVK